MTARRASASRSPNRPPDRRSSRSSTTTTRSAIARLGWLAVLGFLASAAAYACLAAALRHRLRNRLGRIGLFMLSYCALPPR
jgi:hypothetical protein